jgi:hypothetical protein
VDVNNLKFSTINYFIPLIFSFQAAKYPTVSAKVVIKRLLNEIEYDIENYKARHLCYLPKAEVDYTNRNHNYTNLNLNLFTLLKIWNFSALFSKQWTAPGFGNQCVNTFLDRPSVQKKYYCALMESSS